jgi:hypothetical protein
MFFPLYYYRPIFGPPCQVLFSDNLLTNPVFLGEIPEVVPVKPADSVLFEEFSPPVQKFRKLTKSYTEIDIKLHVNW